MREREHHALPRMVLLATKLLAAWGQVRILGYHLLRLAVQEVEL